MVAPAVHPDAADAGPRCIECDYLLVGLPQDGDCPECGTPIERSAPPADLLRNQDPAWLGRLAEGMLWQIAANLVSLALVVIGVLAFLKPETQPGPNQFPLSTALFLLWVLLTWCGAWWVATPEPGVVGRALSLRRSVRVVGTLSAATLLAVNLIDFDSVPAWAVLTVAGAVLPVVDVVLWYLYVHRLALRLPSPGLAFQLLLLLCGGAITDFFVHTLPWLAPVLDEAGVKAGYVYAYGGGRAVIVSNALLIYATYVCFRLRSLLLRARSEAAASRGAEGIPPTGAGPLSPPPGSATG